MEQRLRLGQLLVDASIISKEQLEEVLLLQKQDGRKLGTLLVERNLINETQLTQILSQQLSVPWVSLYHVDFSRRLLSLVPLEVAEKFCLVPIYVRHVRGQGDTLYVAMDDPTNDEALKACQMWAGLPTRAMIASPSDIRNAIRVYYPEARRASVPPPNEVVPPPAAEPAPAAEPPPATQPEPESAQPVAATTQPEPPSTEPENAQPPTEQQQAPEAASAAAWKPARGVDEPTSEAEQAGASEEPTHEAPTEAAPTLPAAGSEPEADQTQPASPEDQVTLEVGAEIPLEEVLPEGRRVPRKRPMTGAERLMSLTLLDGTKLALPVRRLASKRRAPPTLVEETQAERGQEPDQAQEPGQEPIEPPAPSRPSGAPGRMSQPPAEIVPQVEFTARDVVAALRAAAHGVDPTDILGVEPKWQAVLAALLSLMLRKGLIDEKDFVEELKKV
ncbi:MAG: hypothetical protein HY898_02405 [Deltaproteobacteria bacterium]|nr:hypothetical protein [Deltaproteobacteria bacterium]